jgi:uncharacterized membrane protein YczE
MALSTALHRPSRRLPHRYIQLLIGLFLYGIAIAMMVQAAVGIAPWDVLSQGISLHTGIAFGWVTNLVGVVVLLLWIPIRQKPGIGTVLNALLIGPSAQLGLGIIPSPTILWEQILLFTGGLLLLAFATGLYLGARLGPGPRDGLMTGIHARWGWRIWIVRASIELTVLVIGWLLGGNVGFGTLAFALLVGPLVHIAMPLLVVKDRSQPRAPAPAPTGGKNDLAEGVTTPAAEQFLPPRGM